MTDTAAYRPPYITVGLYNREYREALERPNRLTIATIFKRREREKELERRRAVDYANHLDGIHTYGYCEWCGPRYFYD